MNSNTIFNLGSSAAIAFLTMTSCIHTSQKGTVDDGKLKKGSKPNVILVLTDDQGYGDLSCHGNPVLSTPNLDKMHDRSIRFTNYHVAPMCTPTRGLLMSGMDGARNGAVNVASGRNLLRPELETMGSIFANNGYQTATFGKWHLGDNYPFRPEDRGFQESVWFRSANIGSNSDFWGNKYFDPFFIHNGKKEQYKGYCTDILFDQAKQWIQKVKGDEKPFFLYLPTNAAHTPLFAKDEDVKVIEEAIAASEFKDLDPSVKSGLTIFLAMIRNIDTNMGSLVDFLEDEGLKDNTIFIFSTDNGSTYGPKYFNAGMRGMKVELYEGGHRVPLFIEWPGGGFASPQDIGELTEAQDILPTLVELCDLKTSETTHFDGISLAPVLRGEAKIDTNRTLIINYSRMSGDMEHPSPQSYSIMRPENAAVLWKQWRLLENKELYDLQTDPLQKENVIEKYPEVAGKLKSHLDNWWKGVEDIANVPQRSIIGSIHENPIMLTSCEWLDVLVDTESFLYSGFRKNSFWKLIVDQPGDYEFELRRWPREANIALTGNFPPRGGAAYPISSAELLINRDSGEPDSHGSFNIFKKLETIQPGDKSVTFQAHLNAGPVTLQTQFYDAQQNLLCGAFFVNVKRK